MLVSIGYLTNLSMPMGSSFLRSLGNIFFKEYKIMRTIKQLIQKETKVYIYLRNEAVRQRFSKDADNEGITFDDGKKVQRGLWTMLWHYYREARFVFSAL